MTKDYNTDKFMPLETALYIADLQAQLREVKAERDEYWASTVQELQAEVNRVTSVRYVMVTNLQAQLRIARGTLEKIANSKKAKPPVDASECRAIARQALTHLEGEGL